MKKLIKTLVGIVLALVLAQVLLLQPNGMTLKSWVPGEKISGVYCEECCCEGGYRQSFLWVAWGHTSRALL